MSSWRCSCGGFNGQMHQYCEGCGAERPKSERADDPKPVLPAYREFPDRRGTFRGCEHVPVGTREPCAPCAKEIERCKQQLAAYAEKIDRRIVKTERSPQGGVTL